MNLREEVSKHATSELYATIYQEGNDTCLYGVCHYCSPGDPVCGLGEILEGALILWLPSYLKLVKHRHPWQRTYRKSRLALWEADPNYCEKVYNLINKILHSSNYSISQLNHSFSIFDYTF